MWPHIDREMKFHSGRRRVMRRVISIGAVITVVVLVAIGTLAQSSSKPVQSAAHQAASAPAVPVVAQPVKQGDVPIYMSGIGNVQAYNTVTVHTQITGPITDIAFTEGQVVHKGDLLAVIDPRPYQAQLDQAVANQGRDEAQRANAQQVYQRDLPLLAKGWVPDQTVETQKDQVAQYQAMVQSDAAQVESAKVNLSYTRLTSPIDGVVGIRQIDIGNIVHPTDPNGIVVVTQLQPISVIFTLPETDLPQIQQQMAKGPLTVLAYSQDNKTKLDQGTLGVLDNQIVQTSGSVRLKANFSNPDRRLWPGELVNARLLIQTLPNGLTVAAPAVQQGPQGAYVYVVNGDDTVASRPVTIIRQGNLHAVIGSGLKAGEKVVVAGQSRIQAGSNVTLLQGDAAQAALAQQTQQTQQSPIP